MRELYELKDKLVKELENYGAKDVTPSTLEMVDKLAHATKNLCKVIEDEDSGEYSNTYPMYGRSYRSRDRMGRYSGERGYSRDGLPDKMRELMADAPDECTRQDMRRMIEKLENA